MEMTFRVGQKVVCVDAEPRAIWYRDVPKKGAIYTVAGTVVTPAIAERNEYGLLLKEITNCLHYHGAYDPKRFRPIVERKTDISIFTEMLTPDLEKVK